MVKHGIGLIVDQNSKRMKSSKIIDCEKCQQTMVHASIELSKDKESLNMEIKPCVNCGHQMKASTLIKRLNQENRNKD